MMATESLSIGLVGCGGMGRRHLRAYGSLRQVGRAGFELAAVCDPRPEAAQAAADLAAELLGSRPAVFTGIDELIASGVVKAVDVVTDPANHHLIAGPALSAGIHVVCEKPLGLTVRACRAIVDAAPDAGVVLATAENYRRDTTNRLARAVLDSGLLGEIHLMTQTNIGGDDSVMISPWRHLRESGSIALDMGVHYTDVFRYYLGELERVSGSAFIAQPLRKLRADSAPDPRIEVVAPGVMRATGEDSVVALYETASGVPIQLAYVPSGPGRIWTQRTVHGANGSISVPVDRTGEPVVVTLGERALSGADLRRELGGFLLDGVTGKLFGPEGTEYDMPFAEVDAALIAIEIDDFVSAVSEGRSPEVDGLDGLLAVAGLWAVIESQARGERLEIADVANGSITTAQDPVDAAIGLLPRSTRA
jgi:predicted dehydrogenase